MIEPRPCEVEVSVKPPTSLDVIWYNPETGFSAYGIGGLYGSTLWVSIMQKFTSVPLSIDSAGYLSTEITHKMLKTDSSILLTQLLIGLGSLRSPAVPLPPVRKSVLDPGDVLEIRHWAGNDLPEDEYRLSICFREIFAVVAEQTKDDLKTA